MKIFSKKRVSIKFCFFIISLFSLKNISLSCMDFDKNYADRLKKLQEKFDAITTNQNELNKIKQTNEKNVLILEQCNKNLNMLQDTFGKKQALISTLKNDNAYKGSEITCLDRDILSLLADNETLKEKIEKQNQINEELKFQIENFSKVINKK